MKLLICAGGTGGGIYPALAVVAELDALGVSKEDILWIGVQGEMEETVVPRAGLRLETIPGGAIVGVPLMTQIKNGIKLMQSVFLASRLIDRFRPDALLVTGGYMSVPVALAAKLRHLPALVYLPDLEPGAAIRLISRLVDKVAATFQLSEQHFASHQLTATGYPVRAALRRAAEMSRAEALAHFDLTPERPTLFVFGGSRGAWSINQALMPRLVDYLTKIQIVHVSGTQTWPQVEAYAQTVPTALQRYYRPYPYLHERMGAGFRTADLVVARAGASMLGEAPLFGVPAILIPYPHAWRYQKTNADYLAQRGAAVRLNDEKLEADLFPLVMALLTDEPRRQQMARAAAVLSQPDAAQHLARLLVALPGERQHG